MTAPTVNHVAHDAVFYRRTVLPKSPDPKTGLYPAETREFITALPASLRSGAVDRVIQKATSKAARREGKEIIVVKVWSLDITHEDGTIERRENVEQGTGPNQWMPAK